MSRTVRQKTSANFSKKMSRRDFVESKGATCRNWRWSWSFINSNEKVVIFGAWDKYRTEEGSIILDESWELDNRGYRRPAYTEAMEYIRLVESGDYTLKIFRMFYSNEKPEHDKDGYNAPAIRGFTPKLELKKLVKQGGKWLAVD